MAGTTDKDILAGLAEATRDEADFENRHRRGDADGDSVNDLNDGVHDGLVFPSEEDKVTLRRVPDSIPYQAYRENNSTSLPVPMVES
jgi:POT family proton-dependent oligopeptide transporter